MTRHSGVLQRPNFPATKVIIQVSDGKFTMVGAPGKWIGAWPFDDMKFERLTIREFGFTVSHDPWTFVSDDPAAFASAVGIVVDLRATSRFGLGERVRKAREEQRAGR